MARQYHKGERWKVYNYTTLNCKHPLCGRWMLRLGWDRPIEKHPAASAIGRYPSGDAVDICGDGTDPNVYDFNRVEVTCGRCGRPWIVDASTHEVHHPDDVL